MKRLLIIPCLLVITSLMSGQPHSRNNSKEPVPVTEHIDSIVVYSDNSFPSERIFNSIGDLRRHIDSLNHTSTKYHKELALASQRRDSITHAMVQVTIERNRLKDANETLSMELKILKKYPDYLMLLVIVIAGTLIGQGIRKSYINWKHDV